METLTSTQNPALKEIRKAIARGALTEQGFCVAESFHLLEEALRSDCEIEAIYAAESVRSAVQSHVKGLKHTRVIVLDDDLFRSISATEATQGVLSLVKPPQWNLESVFGDAPLVLVLDGIQDPGNAGAMLRAAEAFGASGVALLKGCVNPFNPKALRASAGSAFRIPFVPALDEHLLMAAIQQRGMDLYALMPGGSRGLNECDLSRNCALIVGSEGHGVNQRLSNQAMDVRIPMLGVESLNAAMAASVALYEARRQRMVPVHEPV